MNYETWYLKMDIIFAELEQQVSDEFGIPHTVVMEVLDSKDIYNDIRSALSFLITESEE
ncbi:hypothetical protein D3C86_1850430 [compost metagenome]